MTAQNAEYKAVKECIVVILDDFLDWTGSPWNMAVAEAQRDYDRLATALMDALYCHAQSDGPVTPSSGATSSNLGEHSDGADDAG